MMRVFPPPGKAELICCIMGKSRTERLEAQGGFVDRLGAVCQHMAAGSCLLCLSYELDLRQGLSNH